MPLDSLCLDFFSRDFADFFFFFFLGGRGSVGLMIYRDSIIFRGSNISCSLAKTVHERAKQKLNITVVPLVLLWKRTSYFGHTAPWKPTEQNVDDKAGTLSAKWRRPSTKRISIRQHQHHRDTKELHCHTALLSQWRIALVGTERLMSEVKKTWSKVRVGCWVAINRSCAGQLIYYVSTWLICTY